MCNLVVTLTELRFVDQQLFNLFAIVLGENCSVLFSSFSIVAFLDSM